MTKTKKPNKQKYSFLRNKQITLSMKSMKKASQALSIATFCLVLLSTFNLSSSPKAFAECSGSITTPVTCDPVNNTANISANTIDPTPVNNTATVTDAVCLTSI
jgi:hypothetical protein